mmetsp:Transcript_8213/g.12372  ORF Transcript_8213/g.12372 Transcript_8213/m.12372 type:complete len:188 (-) Transcript_8213:279-842(-)
MEELPTKFDISSSDDPTVARTHYEILGVDEKADLDTIKKAHRKLALRYHPDKQRQAAGNEDGGEDDALTSIFTKIQAAWECLSDQEKRIKYDDSLTRLRERSAGDVIKAQVVKLSEMQCEVCDVEDDEEDVGSVDDRQKLKTQKLYSYMCRCGDYFEVLEEELKSESVDQSNIFECQSCSLSINIIT